MIELSIVIPVYQAEACLPELYRRLNQSLAKITEQYEIILIEDCGGDNSWKIIKELSLRDPRIKGIQFSRNFGQHYGITAGIDHALGNWVVVMDCDLQDRPEEIINLYHKALEGYDVVAAKRKDRQDSGFKKFTSKVFYKMLSYFLGIKYDGDVGNFRIMSRTVVKNLKNMREQLRFLGGLISWLGFKTTTIEVEHAERFAGKSSYDFRKLLTLAIDAIIAYSDKPLRLVIKLGFMIAFFAFLFGIYILLRAAFYHVPVAGWSSLIASIYFIGGMIIANLGIIGIYLGKTFDETKKRPLYVISEKTERIDVK